jgi:hypothetical protein
MSQIQGTNVAAPVVPFSTADVHPSHEAAYGKGGYRSVANATQRNAIPAARREAGMLVYVQDTGVIFQLAPDLSSWVSLSLGSGPAGSLAVLSDTDIQNIANGDLLRYSNSKWRNSPEDNVTDGGNF